MSINVVLLSEANIEIGVTSNQLKDNCLIFTRDNIGFDPTIQGDTNIELCERKEIFHLKMIILFALFQHIVY